MGGMNNGWKPGEMAGRECRRRCEVCVLDEPLVLGLRGTSSLRGKP